MNARILLGTYFSGNCEIGHNAIYSGAPGLNFDFMRREAMIE